MLSRPAVSAGCRTSSATGPPVSSAPAASTSSTRSPSSIAATSTSDRVHGGKPATTAAYVCSSRAVSGSDPVPACCPAVAASSIRPSGLPPASASTRRRRAGDRSGATRSSSNSGSSPVSGPIGASARPAPASRPAARSPSRTAISRNSGSSCNRRPRNASASQLCRSIHCASSTIRQIGPFSPAALSDSRAASPAMYGSTSPIGESNSCRSAANGTRVSACTPVTESTRTPRSRARSPAVSSSALLPMPAVPRSTSTVPASPTARSSAAVIRSSCSVRPTSIRIFPAYASRRASARALRERTPILG